MLYHLSKARKLKTLTPKIPECAVPQYEDTKTKRICFSDSIDGCLSALQCPGKYYVYIPKENISEDSIYYPTVDDVRDAKYTHEVWVLSEINVKCIGIIKCSDIYVKERRNSGRGRVNVFHGQYEWLRKYKDK